jgi:hypothetical protein
LGPDPVHTGVGKRRSLPTVLFFDGKPAIPIGKFPAGESSVDPGVLCLGFLGLGIFNVLDAALAYKLRLGHKPLPMEAGVFWLRALGAGVGLTVLAFVAGGMHGLGVAAGAPPLFTGSMAGLIYIVGGIALFMGAFALDDVSQALSVFLIHHLFPVLVFIVLALAYSYSAWSLQKVGF